MNTPLRVLITVPFGAHHMQRLQEAAGPHAVLRQTDAPAASERMRSVLQDADVVIG